MCSPLGDASSFTCPPINEQKEGWLAAVGVALAFSRPASSLSFERARSKLVCGQSRKLLSHKRTGRFLEYPYKSKISGFAGQHAHNALTPHPLTRGYIDDIDGLGCAIYQEKLVETPGCYQWTKVRVKNGNRNDEVSGRKTTSRDR